MAGQPGFFDADERRKALSAAGDPLERLTAAVDSELFRTDLEAALGRSERTKGGRPPYDAVLMFKALVLQTPGSPPRTAASAWLCGRSALARATTKITLANLAYNMRRLVKTEGRTLPA